MKAAPEKMMKHNESSERMSKSKCENDLVSCPPFKNISFDLSATDDMKSIITKNKTSGQNMK